MEHTGDNIKKQADDSAHEHTHTHTHAHAHTHDHEHSSGLSIGSAEEALALLEYMLHHNEHHAEELHDLAHCFDDTSADLIHAAVEDIKQSNYKLEAALKMIKEGYSDVSV